MASDAETSRGWTLMRGAVAERCCKPAFEAPRGRNATTYGTTLNRHSWSDPGEWIAKLGGNRLIVTFRKLREASGRNTSAAPLEDEMGDGRGFLRS
jgi:hypothetical protein